MAKTKCHLAVDYRAVSYSRYSKELQSWTKVLGQVCTFGAFVHTADTNTISPT